MKTKFIKVALFHLLSTIYGFPDKSRLSRIISIVDVYDGAKYSIRTVVSSLAVEMFIVLLDGAQRERRSTEEIRGKLILGWRNAGKLEFGQKFSLFSSPERVGCWIHEDGIKCFVDLATLTFCS
jgi:hypothetical protein